jgi:pseudaminic acid synthase
VLLHDGKCYVIAEAGSCFMGSKGDAYGLIEAAADAGADACKFQLFRLADILIDPSKGDPKTELPVGWIPDLSRACQECGIDFLCTPFAPWAVEALKPYVWAYKIGSFEHARRDIWDSVAKTGKPIIASCGRRSVIAHLRLYCVSKYPSLPEDIRLPDHDSPFDGFSDHTTSTLIPALAVARGARIIEKHLRLPETTSDCPDFPHSLEPSQFAEMVKNIRLAEVVCWRQQPESQELSRYPNRRE